MEFLLIIKQAFIVLCVTFCSMNCLAQQRIIMYDKSESGQLNKAHSFTLPISVTCKFKNGNRRQLVIEKIIGDSFIFQQKENMLDINNCIYNDIQHIVFHADGYHLRNVLAITTTVMTAFTNTFTLYYMANKSEVNDGNPYLQIVIIPLDFVVNGLNILALNNLPTRYTTNRYSYFLK